MSYTFGEGHARLSSLREPLTAGCMLGRLRRILGTSRAAHGCMLGRLRRILGTSRAAQRLFDQRAHASGGTKDSFMGDLAMIVIARWHVKARSPVEESDKNHSETGFGFLSEFWV
jgi:hypothetical protein